MLTFAKNNKVVKFFDITEWGEKKFFQTRGTRDKCVVENPADSSFYYFKTSINVRDKNYKHEFWSEIIASHVGKLLGFNTLTYDIARKGDKIGCISKEMNPGTSVLTEGRSFLTGYDNTYKPSDKSSYKHYTLEFILNSISAYKLESQIYSFYKVLIFDFIIGNSDRHQENWGFITQTNHTWKHKAYLFLKTKKPIKNFILWILPSKVISKMSKSFVSNLSNQFSPIYDSGCCLARELSDERVNMMLNNELMIESFVNRGQAEIRKEDGSKYKHTELVSTLLDKDKANISEMINEILNKYDEHKIKKIVNEIDKELPPEFGDHSLPEPRKELIIKILISKKNKLKELL